MTKILTMLTVCLLAAPAGAQAYDPFTDPISDYEGYDPFNDPMTRELHEPQPDLMKEMEERWHRQRIETHLMEEAIREEAREAHHQQLHWCAPYNRGCAQELYGN